MRKLLFAAAAAGITAAVLGAGTASADDERHCYSPQVGPWPTVDVCTYLPIDPKIES